MTLNLEDLCSVNEVDFNDIFNDFFIVRGLDQKDLESKLDSTNIYKNYRINKIEIIEGIDYQEFIEKLLKHFNNYYYDGNRQKDKDRRHLLKAYEWINSYTPNTGVPLEEFKQTIFNRRNGEYYLDGSNIVTTMSKNEENVIRDFLKKSSISNVLELDKDTNYILITKQNKITVRTGSQILGHLHGDIGEFILFFLVEVVLKQPIFFSKIRHCKSGAGDKVKGTDGIHISLKDNKVRFNFLESKFKKTFEGSLEDAIASQELLLGIGTTEGSLNNELHILESKGALVDSLFLGLFEGGFENYINPYYVQEGGRNQKDLPFDLTSGLIYECSSYEDVIKKRKTAQSHVDNITFGRIQQTLEAYKEIEGLLDNRRVTIFLLPLINNEELIKIFLDQTKT